MKKKIETETTITIRLGEDEFYLTKEEATDLYNSLKESLGVKDPIIPKWPLENTPTIPCNPPPQPYLPPQWPEYPKPYEIWCKVDGNNTTM